MLTPSTPIVFRVLFCALLATSVGQNVMLTTLPSLGREVALSEFQIAAIMSSSALIFALGTSAWSKIAKRVGFKRILMIGLTGYSVGTFAFATTWMAGLTGIFSGTNLFLALLISRSLQSTIMSATPPSAVGYAVAISSSQTRVSAISKVTSASNVGQILGPAYAGLLVGFGLLVPLYSIIALTLLALFFVSVKLPVLPPVSHQQPVTSQNKTSEVTTKIPFVFIAACVCVFLAMAMMQQSLGFYFIDFYQLSPVDAAQQVGFAMMSSAAASLAIQYTVVQKARMTKESMIALSLPILAIAYFILFLHETLYVIYVAMACMGLGMGMAYPSLAAAATTYCTTTQQSAITGLITATPAMGYIFGPPLAALVYQKNIALPFGVASALLALTTCVIFITLKRIKSKLNS